MTPQTPPPPPSPPALPPGSAGRIFAFAAEAARGSGDVPEAAELGALLPEYEFTGLIGRGGMGAVYAAVQTKLGRRVAVKVLPLSLGDEPGFADRFRREASTMASLQHPGIVSVHDSGETLAGHCFYVMELVEGEDLARRMAHGPVSVAAAVPLLRALCEALDFAHRQGVVHRDIKPSNVLLTTDGAPKLADFGLALLAEKERALSRLTLGGTTLGTLEYAAPEQLEGAAVSAASDLYSLGVLAYELLTGELPRGIFDPPSVRNPQVDPAFDGVVLRALQSDPARRHASAAEFAAALQAASARRLRDEERDRAARRQLRRRTRVAAVAGGVAVVTLSLAAVAWRERRRAVAGELAANERRVAAERAEAATDDVIHFLLTDLRARLEKTGNLGAMESVLERAVTHFRTKHEQSGHSPGTATELANALTVKADVLMARGVDEAGLALLAEAISLLESAENAAPSDAARAERTDRAYRQRSGHFLMRGRFQEALDDALHALERARARPERRRSLATSHITLANALGYLKRLDECHAEYEKGRLLLAAELEQQPDDAALAAEHAACDMSLGSLAEERENFPEMLRHFGAWHEFVARTEGRESNAYLHAAVRLAHALVLNDRAAEAQPFLAHATRVAEAETEARPGHKGVLAQLRFCLTVTEKMHARLGAAAAAAAVRKRLREVDAALDAAPQPVGSLRAAPETSASELFAALLESPEDDDAQFAWAMASEAVGKNEEANGGAAAAMRHYERQFERLRPHLEAAEPGSWWTLGASYTLGRLGELKERGADWTGAEATFRQTLDLRRRTLASHPEEPREARNVVSTTIRLARALVSLGRTTEARELWRQILFELRSRPEASKLEWRALAVSGLQEVLTALPPAEAAELKQTARDFLLARGPEALSRAEEAALASLTSEAAEKN